MFFTCYALLAANLSPTLFPRYWGSVRSVCDQIFERPSTEASYRDRYERHLPRRRCTRSLPVTSEGSTALLRQCVWYWTLSLENRVSDLLPAANLVGIQEMPMTRLLDIQTNSGSHVYSLSFRSSGLARFIISVLHKLISEPGVACCGGMTLPGFTPLLRS